jgi:GNAT superfamily N-acetyltransferase
MAKEWIFDEAYREILVLNDNSRIIIRPIKPSDRQKLLEAFRRLSPESLYRRCFSLKKELSAGELNFFTDVDGIDHFALVAVLLDPDDHESEGEGIGGARFIRLADDADVAEVAFLVSDDWQHKGIGRVLLQRLIAAARERGIARMRCYLLAENHQARQFIRNVCWHVSFHNEETLIAAEFALDHSTDAAPENTDNDIFTMLQMAARGYAIVPATLAGIASDLWWREIKRSLLIWHNAIRSDAA